MSTVMFACAPVDEDNGDGETNVTGSIVLDKETLNLEKRESFTLTAQLKDVEGEITWSSSDTSVATVNSGAITAVGEGQAVITASIDTIKAVCYVFVEDNNQNLVVSTNFSDQQNIINSDQKNIAVTVFYNNKLISDASVSFSVLGDAGVLSLENNVVSAIGVGSAQLVITAQWKDLEYVKVIEINVVPNMTARMSNFNYVTLKTVGEDDETSLELDFVVYENGVKLSDSEFTVNFAQVDDNVIRISDGFIYAEGKGDVIVSATITSINSGNSLLVTLPVSVVLVNQDKSDSIKIKDLAWDDSEYSLTLGEVFSDVETNKLNGCNILSITDITNLEYQIPFNNGKVDIEFIENNNILGDRVWRIECEKYSYDVSIYIEKINTDTLVASMAGTYKPVSNSAYTYASWETIVIGETGTIRAYGHAQSTVKIEPIDSNYGTIKHGTNSNICNGYYVKDGDNFNLFIYSIDNSYRHTVQFCKTGVTPIDENAIYAKLAGAYTDKNNNTLTLSADNAENSEKSSKAGNAKKISGKIDTYNVQPTYDIIVTSANTGIIIISSANGGYLNHTATYVIDGDVVTITVKYGNGLVFTKN
ncbi:MAG: Ig-like domain-containing protein [Clostridia bacterium]|nr:Ig-like domain-containing protein [Clostridia bacterium]